MPDMHQVWMWKLNTYFVIKFYKISSLQEAYTLDVGVVVRKDKFIC